ncbi:MAG: flavodoxin domain-containing protein [Oscillospiraceae bacterium]|jgi:flavodoxin|nr:flavodoxin domain-containing protein [Oscillospiraceae bacterium]
MNIKLVYYTKTGHSRKIAEAVGNELAIEPLDIADNPTLFGADILFIVGGIYNGVSAGEMIQFGEKLRPAMAQRVAIITSSAFRKDTQQQLSMTLKSNYIEVVGECLVRGAFTVISMGHPNKQDYNTAVEFAKNLIQEFEDQADNESAK